jgi:hypothetical protein
VDTLIASGGQHGLTYPTPTVDRDEHLNQMHSKLKSWGILSRGRFGAWRYEAGNQDHSCMQGVEAAGRVLFGAPELTLWHPELVNTGKHRDQRICDSKAPGPRAVTPVFQK